MDMYFICRQHEMGVLRSQDQPLDIRFAHRVLGIIGTRAAIAATDSALAVVCSPKIPCLAGGDAERVFEFLVRAAETVEGTRSVAETRICGVITARVNLLNSTTRNAGNVTERIFISSEVGRRKEAII
jgi:hypothetical protein